MGHGNECVLAFDSLRRRINAAKPAKSFQQPLTLSFAQTPTPHALSIGRLITIIICTFVQILLNTQSSYVLGHTGQHIFSTVLGS